jgi:hypothetical protein
VKIRETKHKDMILKGELLVAGQMGEGNKDKRD